MRSRPVFTWPWRPDGKPIVQGPKAKKHNYEFAHPGYAWAATRGAIDAVGGLVETAALGAADHHMALALIGRVDDSIPGNISKAYRRPLMQWQARAMKYINTNLGVVPGTIEHGWHGSKEARKYVDRWEILIRNEFDPYEDLYKNSYGVLELADTKPRLRKQIDAYFRQRNEDANSL